MHNTNTYLLSLCIPDRSTVHGLKTHRRIVVIVGVTQIIWQSIITMALPPTCVLRQSLRVQDSVLVDTMVCGDPRGSRYADTRSKADRPRNSAACERLNNDNDIVMIGPDLLPYRAVSSYYYDESSARHGRPARRSAPVTVHGCVLC